MKLKLSLLAIRILAFTAISATPLPKKTITINHSATLQQAASGFSTFRTHRQGRGITSTWSFSSTASVLWFTVQKTYEDPNDQYSNWTDVSSMPCDGSRSYKYHDNDVLPGYLNYRVKAELSDGTSVLSEISTVRIVSH